MSASTRWLRATTLLAAGTLALATSGPGSAQTVGPFNATFPAGGDEIARDLPGLPAGSTLPANAPWTLSAWVRPSETPTEPALIAGVGGPARAAI
jgi:hypothetical protein